MECCEGFIRLNVKIQKANEKGGFGFIKTIIKLAIFGAIIYFGWQYKDQIMKMVNKS
jgi:hypothetical protein